MSIYWEESLPEALTEAGYEVMGGDIKALCKRVSRLADAESSYSPPVSHARIGPSDYERGIQEGRRQAMEEVYSALGQSLEIARVREGLRLQMSEETAWRGHSGVKIG